MRVTKFGALCYVVTPRKTKTLSLESLPGNNSVLAVREAPPPPTPHGEPGPGTGLSSDLRIFDCEHSSASDLALSRSHKEESGLPLLLLTERSCTYPKQWPGKEKSYETIM